MSKEIEWIRAFIDSPIKTTRVRFENEYVVYTTPCRKCKKCMENILIGDYDDSLVKIRRNKVCKNCRIRSGKENILRYMKLKLKI
jgi:hypothetical protein